LNFLKKIAPFLATGLSLAGPIGTMAGNALTQVLGVKPGSSPADLLAQLTKTPPTQEQILALQQADDVFKAQMATIKIESIEELAKMDEADMSSARQRETDLAKAGAKDNTPKWLAGIVTFGALFIAAMVFSGHANSVLVNPASAALAGTIVGYIFKDYSQVLGYYFGSSRGSEEKSATIAEIAKEP
jgi:hypothetical protein